MARAPRLLCLAVSFSVLALCGCGAEEEHAVGAVTAEIQRMAREARALGYEQQAQALDDGVVTEAEYRQGYSDAVTCFARGGARVQGPTQLPTVHGFDWDYVRFGGDDLDCAIRFHEFLNGAWNWQERETLTPVALDVLRSCFEQSGKPMSSAKFLSDFLDADRGLFDVCIMEAAEEVADGGDIILTY